MHVLWHCLLASLGDGLFVVAIFATGWRLLGHLIGLWSYSNQMIIVPSFRVALAPVVQMVVLPPLIFRSVARWRHKRDCLRIRATSVGFSYFDWLWVSECRRGG